MWRDARFWAAMLAAQLYWSVMWLVNRDAVQLHWPQASRALLLIVFAYPVLEEIVFRGLLHEYLRRHLPWRLPGPVSSTNPVRVPNCNAFAGRFVRSI